MKILIVTNMYPSAGDVSWRGSFVEEQVESYRQQYQEARIDVFHIKGNVSGGSNINYLSSFPKLIFKLLFGRFDIVHCHHSFCVLLCIPWFYRLIYTIHEGELNNTSLRSWIIKLAIHFSRTPIFVSKTEFGKSKREEKKLLPCGVNFDTFKPAPDKVQLRKLLKLPVNQKVILFPADPSRPEKNASILKSVEEIAVYQNKKWYFVYGGKIPKLEMPNWMAAADVVVSIGKYESDGMVIKEAISCNTAILSTDVGNSSYYIDASCGLVVAADQDAVYAGLEIILNNSSIFSYGRERLNLLALDVESVAVALHNIYVHNCKPQ